MLLLPHRSFQLRLLCLEVRYWDRLKVRETFMNIPCEILCGKDSYSIQQQLFVRQFHNLALSEKLLSHRFHNMFHKCHVVAICFSGLLATTATAFGQTTSWTPLSKWSWQWRGRRSCRSWPRQLRPDDEGGTRITHAEAAKEDQSAGHFSRENCLRGTISGHVQIMIHG